MPWAFFAGAAVGVLGGRIGLGGAEFRLPLLIGVFGMGSSVAIRRLGARLMPWVVAEQKAA